MPREFAIPRGYRSDLIEGIKKKRVSEDPRKLDLNPSQLVKGDLIFKISRFFGFCFGVENAIEIAYRAVEENPGKRIFLISEMIHNPHVNQDLLKLGVRFLQTPSGEQLFSISELTPDDVVIVPAFGTTVELFKKLAQQGVSIEKYNATCPFVEKVWKRGRQLGEGGFSIVIHGKDTHEETRATFSHVGVSGPSVVVRDQKETELLAKYVRGELPSEQFFVDFKGRHSDGFSVPQDLQKLGVVNQTTMLAEETHAIAEMIKATLVERFGENEISDHYADTRDTLCYATSENQRSMRVLLDDKGDIAVVVGGYNSSNTSHLAELCAGRVPVFYVKDADEILSADEIRHLNIDSHTVEISRDWLPKQSGKITILVSAGASCPDATVEAVIERIGVVYEESKVHLAEVN